MRIGLCGTGRMGTAIGLRLMDMGHDLVIWNRTREHTATLADAGAEIAQSPAEVASAAEAIIDIVLDEASVARVISGPDGLTSSGLDGRVVIEMSTITPEAARRAEQAVVAAGGQFLECPVGGTVMPARQGNLIGYIGGMEEAAARAKPILDALCRRSEHLGPVGAGATMKLAVNLPLIVYWEAAAEALMLTRAAGIDLQLAADLLVDSAGAARVAEMRMPAISSAIAGADDGSVGFSLAGMAKDLRLMDETARRQDMKLPLVDAARQLYDKAVADGWGERDGALLAAWRQKAAADESAS